jgi:Homoserine acetyltransferase
MGISMGAINALQWSVSYPGSVDWVVAVAGTPRQTAYDLLLWQAQMDIIRSTRGIEGEGSRP